MTEFQKQRNCQPGLICTQVRTRTHAQHMQDWKWCHPTINPFWHLSMPVTLLPWQQFLQNNNIVATLTQYDTTSEACVAERWTSHFYFPFKLPLVPLVVHAFHPDVICSFRSLLCNTVQVCVWARLGCFSFQNETDVKVGQAYLCAHKLSLLQGACVCVCVFQICVHPRQSPKINSSFIHVSAFSGTEHHTPLFFCLLLSHLLSSMHPKTWKKRVG